MREYLFNLIGQVQDCGCDVTDVVAMNFVENDKLVDWLIANGVTIQKWIPASEIPWMGEEIAKLCIRYMEDYADFHGYASSKKVKAHIIRLLQAEQEGRIAILPEPPKVG